MNGALVSAVYTNDPKIKVAYESLKGQMYSVGGHNKQLNIPVYPIVAEATQGLPSGEELLAMSREKLKEEFGVADRADGKLRKKADMIAEILEG